MSTDPELPHGELSIRTIAMPKDANPFGDIFGGWLMSQMDLAGGYFAFHQTGGRVVTVGVDRISFHQPVRIGDELSCYCVEERRGRTSISIRVECWIRRLEGNRHEKVTEGLYTYVAVHKDGAKRTLEPV